MSKIEKYLHNEYDNEAGKRHASKRTKIVATVGPACDSYEQLLELVKAGVNVFRLNFSHGEHADKARIIQYIQEINKTEPYNIAILADLQGPKLRVGDLKDGKLDLTEGDVLTFTNEKVIGDFEKIYVSYPNLSADVKVGEKILIDDGKLEVVVQEITPNKEVKVRVTLPGTLYPKKGVNLPDTDISLPSLTEKDLTDLAFILTHPIEWVALSFVRNPADIT
ncbi:MAG: pyruvate kinase, partial [Bacteroidota bacterium]